MRALEPVCASRLAADRFSLGQSRRLEARYAEADSLIQEGTDLYTKAQGPDHPNVAYGLANLAMSRYYQGKYDLAEQDARRAQKIVAKLPKVRRCLQCAWPDTKPDRAVARGRTSTAGGAGDS